MRFLVMVKGTEDSEKPGAQPSEEVLTAMSRFNERLMSEGRIVMADGLQPSYEGCRVLFDGDAEPRVVDGPFAETKELVAGFWVLNGDSLEDVVQLMRQAPNPEKAGGVIEIRPLDS